MFTVILRDDFLRLSFLGLSFTALVHSFGPRKLLACIPESNGLYCLRGTLIKKKNGGVCGMCEAKPYCSQVLAGKQVSSLAVT